VEGTGAHEPVTLFLCGDVMTGRGVDQVLPHPGDPRLLEAYATSALDYVELAEEASGPIPRPLSFEALWGAALPELERVAPEARIANLETAVTRSEDAAPKGIHYRMTPENAPVLAAADLDACTLANNHVLDWGRAGLLETLDTLRGAGIAVAGAGRDAAEAEAPAVLPLGRGGRRGRILLFSLASVTSGVPPSWAATPERPGVALLEEGSRSRVAAASPGRVVERIGAWLRRERRPGDRVVVSLHWGPNWGYDIPGDQRELAHALVEEAGADVVHGHSSHHPKGIEVHRGRPILYGCGDFFNDYEGIGGQGSYRGELVLMYFPCLDRRSGELLALEMTPLRLRGLRLERASAEEARWLGETLDRESRRLGAAVELSAAGRLASRW